MIPIPHPADGRLATEPVAAHDRALFAQLDYTRVPERDARRPWPGPPPHPTPAYGKAQLVKLAEHLPHITELQRLLVDHSLLVCELGFRLVADPQSPYGFDVERTVSRRRCDSGDSIG